MEMSHRSKEYEAINTRAEANLKRLLGVGDGYRVLFVRVDREVGTHAAANLQGVRVVTDQAHLPGAVGSRDLQRREPDGRVVLFAGVGACCRASCPKPSLKRFS